MKLAVVSHKPCWRSPASPSGYATDGGFAFQIGALAELFDSTAVVVPIVPHRGAGEVALTGKKLTVVPVSPPKGRAIWRKIGMLEWIIQNGPVLLRAARRADAVHSPIPGDIGTIGMLVAFVVGKPLYVRYCGNWFVQKTWAERFWKWFMVRVGGGCRVMLATGGATEPPSRRNPNVRWIFSTTLTEQELGAGTPRELGNRERIRLITACRQETAKGTGVVIESLPLLVEEFPGVTLDVVGDGAALAEFRETAVVRGVAARVTFHGKVGHARVLQLLRQADLFCYPTTASEGFPKVVLEALASGLPVVTTRVSVLPQLIGAGSGLLLEEPTPVAVARAVRECLSDARRYRAMSANALRTARQYSLERWRDTIGDLLRAAWGPLAGCVSEPVRAGPTLAEDVELRRPSTYSVPSDTEPIAPSIRVSAAPRPRNRG